MTNVHDIDNIYYICIISTLNVEHIADKSADKTPKETTLFHSDFVQVKEDISETSQKHTFAAKSSIQRF